MQFSDISPQVGGEVGQDPHEPISNVVGFMHPTTAGINIGMGTGVTTAYENEAPVETAMHGAGQLAHSLSLQQDMGPLLRATVESV